MLFKHGLFSVTAIVCVAFSQANAEIIVSNGSFEAPTPTATDLTNGYSTALPTGWSVSPNGPGVIVYPSGGGHWYGSTAPDGDAIYALESQYGSAAVGIQQDLGTMTGGDTYTFHATLIGSADGWNSGYTFSIYDVTPTTPRLLASVTEALCNPSAGANGGTAATLAAQFAYPATADDNGHTMRLVLETKAATSSEVWRTGIDSLFVTTTAVPEPGSMVLAACGLIGLLAYAWRKRK